MTAGRVALAIAVIVCAAVFSIWAARIGLGLLLMSAFSGTCKDTVVTELPSPDRTRKAVLYVRDCGATTRASTKVTIVPASRQQPRYRDPIVFSGYEVPWDAKEHKVALRWDGDRRLVVTYARDVELTKLENFANDVHVQFEAAP